MLELLKSFGAEPHLRGIATVGGILSFVVLAITLTVRAWRFRYVLLKPFRWSKRRRARAILEDYFQSKRLKRLGMSDLYIGSFYFKRLVHKAGSIIFEIIISLVNYAAYAESDYKGTFNYLMYWAFLMVAVYDIFTLRSSAYKAFDMITFANRPIAGLYLLKRQLKTIRKSLW